MPTERDRYYSAPPSTHNIANQYIWDGNAVITGSNPTITGVWRPVLSTDLAANINVTGGLTVQTNPSVAITGNPSVYVSNMPYKIGITGDINATGVMGITGDVNLVGQVGISGSVVVAGSTYQSLVSGLTNGTIIIPTGSKSWSVAVKSGSCYFNQTLLNEGTSLNGGGFDGRYTLNSAISIGCTGGRTIVMWEL